MPSCHYRILSQARYTHAMSNVHACDEQCTRMHDAVVTNVWQWTRVLWRGSNCLLRQASRTHIDLEDTQRIHSSSIITQVELLVTGLTLVNRKLALRL